MLAKEVWKESGLKLPIWTNQQNDFIDILWKLRGTEEFDWEVFAATAWSIWNNRNLVKHDGRCKLAKAIAKEVSNYAEEFRQGSAPPAPPVRQNP